jgi:hypothetical protein
MKTLLQFIWENLVQHSLNPLYDYNVIDFSRFTDREPMQYQMALGPDVLGSITTDAQTQLIPARLDIATLAHNENANHTGDVTTGLPVIASLAAMKGYINQDEHDAISALEGYDLSEEEYFSNKEIPADEEVPPPPYSRRDPPDRHEGYLTLGSICDSWVDDDGDVQLDKWTGSIWDVEQDLAVRGKDK